MNLILGIVCFVLIVFFNLGYGLLMEGVSLRLLPGKKKRRYFWLRLIFFAGVARMPLWIGDENLLFLFLFFILIFWYCYEAPPLAKIVVGITFFLLLTPVNMMLDTISFTKYSYWIEDTLNTGIKFLFAILCWFFCRKMTEKGKTVQLPSRLYSKAGSIQSWLRNRRDERNCSSLRWSIGNNNSG